MVLKHVDKLPEKEKKGLHQKNSLQKMIDDFCAGDSDIVKIEFTKAEYTGIKSCYYSVQSAVRQSKRPVKLIQRNNELYLVKIK